MPGQRPRLCGGRAFFEQRARQREAATRGSGRASFLCLCPFCSIACDFASFAPGSSGVRLYEALQGFGFRLEGLRQVQVSRDLGLGVWHSGL